MKGQMTKITGTQIINVLSQFTTKVSTGIFQEHDRVGASRKFEQSNEMLPTAYLLLYMSVYAYKLLNLPLNFLKILKNLIQKLFWR